MSIMNSHARGEEKCSFYAHFAYMGRELFCHICTYASVMFKRETVIEKYMDVLTRIVRK